MNENRLYKFRPINKYSIESLVTPSLYFAAPAALNDPFDCNINLDSMLEAAVALSEGMPNFLIGNLQDPKVLSSLRRLLTEVGICAFSSECYARVLWTHYADQHKGMCIRYRFPEQFTTDRNILIGSYKVKYKREMVGDLIAFADKHSLLTHKEFAEEVAGFLLSAKSTVWRYEREIRLVRNVPGILEIDPRYIEQICFGLQTPEADIKLVKTLAKAHCPSVIFCRMVRDDRDFGYKRERISSN